jgi:hypothetical protein
MSRFVFAVLATTLFVGIACAAVSEVRAATVCDAAACINIRCKGAKGNNIQTCNSGCQIDAAENKKKGLCK